jgi:Triosephosphate isomerase
MIASAIVMWTLTVVDSFGVLPTTTTSRHELARTVLDMATRRPFISGNWKLNPQSRAEAITLASEIANAITPDSPDADVALFVPYVFIESAMNAVENKLLVGAEVRREPQQLLHVCVSSGWPCKYPIRCVVHSPLQILFISLASM